MSTPQENIGRASVADFAKRIRERAGAYSDVDDVELVTRFVRRNPAYADKVELPDGFSVRRSTTGHPKLDELYEQAGRAHNVDVDLLIEQGRQETINFKPDVIYGRQDSPAGARGAGQFMPDTARQFHMRVDGAVDDRRDPVKSISAQARMMRQLLDKHNGDERAALAAYNSGHNLSTAGALRNAERIPETRGYVRQITGKYGALDSTHVTYTRPRRDSAPPTEPALTMPQAPQTVTDNDPAVLAPVQFYAETPEQILANREAAGREKVRVKKVRQAKAKVDALRRKVRAPGMDYLPGESPEEQRAARFRFGEREPSEFTQNFQAHRRYEGQGGREYARGLQRQLEDATTTYRRLRTRPDNLNPARLSEIKLAEGVARTAARPNPPEQGSGLGAVRVEDERRLRSEPDELAKDRAFYESLPEEAKRPALGLRPDDINFNDPAQLRAARLKHEADTGRAQAEAEKITSVPATAQLRTLAGNLVGGIAEIPASVLDTVGTIAYEIDRKAFGSKKARADYFTTEAARRIRENAQKDLTPDARLAGTFVFDTLPKAFGSALGFAGPGWVTKSRYIVPAFLGVTAGFSEGYADAKRAGASDDDAFLSALLNGGMGASEVVTVAPWVRRLNKATGGRFGRVLAKTGAETAEEAVQRALREPSLRRVILKEMRQEGAQEALQTSFGNVVANTLVGYDPNRRTLENVPSSAAAGALVGAGMSAGTQALERSAAPVPESTETLRAQFQSALSPDSPRAAVLVTPGENVRTPKGFYVVETTEGTLHLNRAKAEALGLTTPEAIETFIAEQGVAPLIGKVAPVADTTQGAALRTEDAAGTELSTSIVPTPEAAEAQAEVDKAQFPQATNQEVMPAEAAVRRRLAEAEAELGGEVKRPRPGEGREAFARRRLAETEAELNSLRSAGAAQPKPGESREDYLSRAVAEAEAELRAMDESPAPREFEHTQFGRVTEEGPAGKGKVKVVDEAGQSHVIQEPKANGRGNERAVPVRRTGIVINPKAAGEMSAASSFPQNAPAGEIGSTSILPPQPVSTRAEAATAAPSTETGETPVPTPIPVTTPLSGPSVVVQVQGREERGIRIPLTDYDKFELNYRREKETDRIRVLFDDGTEGVVRPFQVLEEGPTRSLPGRMAPRGEEKISNTGTQKRDTPATTPQESRYTRRKAAPKVEAEQTAPANAKQPTRYQQTGIRRRASFDPSTHDLTRFVVASGGIRVDKDNANRGELARFQRLRPGLLNNKSGSSAEEMARAAAEAGFATLEDGNYYVPDAQVLNITTASADRLLEMLEEDARGLRKHYTRENEITESEVDELSPEQREEFDAEMRFLSDSHVVKSLQQVRDGNEDEGLREELYILAANYGIADEVVDFNLDYARESGAARQGDGEGRAEEDSGEADISFDFTDESPLKAARPTTPNTKHVEELRSADFSDLVPSATVERSGHLLEVNAEGHEILRRAFEQNLIRAGQGEGPAESAFDGVFINREQIRETVRSLKDAAREMRESGYEEAEAAKLDSIASDLIAAAREGKGTAVAYLFDYAIPHEEFHRAGYVGAIEEALSMRHANFTELASHPAVQKAWDTYFNRVEGYARTDEALLVEETAAWIAGGKAETLGLSEDEAVDYLDKWFESYAERNGDDALLQFVETGLTHVREIIGQVQTRRADRRASQEGVQRGGAGVRGAPQESREAPRGDTSGATESSPEKRQVARRALPETLREQGLAAADELYEIYPDKAATADAKKLLEDLGFEGSIRLLESDLQHGAEHVQLSKILQRALLSEATDISASNPAEASRLRTRQQELASALAARMTRGGQFIRGAQVLDSSAEDVMATAAKVAKERGKKLTPTEAERVHRVGEELEQAAASLEVAAREVSERRRKVEDEKELQARAEEGALTKREIEALRKRLASLREKERRREDAIKELEGQIPRKSRKPPTRKAPRQIAAEALASEEAALLADLQAALGMGSPLKMVAGEQGAARLDDAVKRIDNLRVAREMEKAGKDAKTIWLATGWERGGDGKWKTEIDDAGTTTRPLFESLKKHAHDGVTLPFKYDQVTYRKLGEGIYDVSFRREDAKNVTKDFFRLKGVTLYDLGNVSPEVEQMIRERKGTEEETFDDKFDIVMHRLIEEGGEVRANALPLVDAINHTELFDAYPQLQNMTVTFDAKKNMFNGERGSLGRDADGDPVIILSPNWSDAEIKSTLHHEIQHAIQDIEGFAKGGSPDTLRGTQYKVNDAAIQHYDREAEKVFDKGSNEFQNLVRTVNQEISYKKDVPNRFNEQRFLAAVDKLNEKYHDEYNRYTNWHAKKFYAARDNTDVLTPHEVYRRLGGEVEARNVQTRLGMSAAERAAKTLAETEDVDRASQIYLKQAVASPALKMARAEGDTAPKAEVPPLDKPTLDKLARLGALKLLRADKGSLTVADFKRDLIRDFPRAAAQVDAVHAEAVRIAKEEVRKAHYEKTLDQIAAREGNEDLTREQLEKIAAEEREVKRRTALVQAEHDRAMKTEGRKVQGVELRSKALATAIARNAKSDEEALAAARLTVKPTPEDVKTGGVVLEAARKEVNAQRVLAAALKDRAAESEAEVDRALADLQQARRDRAAAHQSVARELERIRKGKVRQAAKQAWRESKGVMIAMQASGDMSNLLRQGGIPAMMQPQLFPEFAKATLTSVREAGFAKNVDVIERGADFALKQRMGIDFAFAGGKSQGEEFFEGADVLQRIPVVKQTVGRYVRKSDEVFGGGLDHLRDSLGTLWIDQLRSQGVMYAEHPEAYKTIGRFINIITGRADIGEHNTAVTRALLSVTKLIGFSPRYRLSRIQFLTLPFNSSFYQSHPAARRIVYKNVVRYYATLGGTLGALSALGYLTGALAVGFFDPEDDDWLKVKIGSLRLDLTAGDQTQARAAFRVIAEGYRGATGEVTGAMAFDRVIGSGLDSIAGRWLRAGADPRASLAADWFTGENFSGEPFKWGGLDGAIATRLMPISAANVIKTMQKEGPALAASQYAADFVGIGSQVYPDRADEPKTKAERLAARFTTKDMKSGKPRTEETRRKLDELKGRARKGEDVRAEVEPLVESGVITEGHGESIIKAKTQTLLQEKFRQLSLEDAKHVLKYATQAERESVADIVRAKQLNEAEKQAREEKKRANPAKAEADRRRSERAKERKRRKQEVRYGRNLSP